MTPDHDRNKEEKIALILGGGGSKAAFAVGAVSALREALGRAPDIVVGAGTGALMAPLCATDELTVLREVFATLETREMLKVNLRGLFWSAVYDHRPLERLLQAVITEQRFRRFQGANCRALLTTLALQSGELQLWSQRPGPGAREVISRRHLIEVLLASASQPLLMPPVQISPDVDQHVHGGLASAAPLAQAIAHGATTIYTVMLTPPEAPPARQHFGWVGGTGWRFLEVMAEKLLVNDLRRALDTNRVLRERAALEARAAELLDDDQYRALFAGNSSDEGVQRQRRLLDLYVIHPERGLPGDGRTFSPAAARDLMTRGTEAVHLALSAGPLEGWPGADHEG